MFPATPDEKNASTSATAWTILALHELLQQGLVPAELREKAAVAAFERGPIGSPGEP